MATPVRVLSSSDVSVGDPTKASHYNTARDDIELALTEFDYGDTADLPGSPALGQVFMDKEADILYAAFDAGTWVAIASSGGLTPRFDDNEKLFFGDDDDAAIYYNTTNLVIDPQEVGAGELRVEAPLDITYVGTSNRGRLINVSGTVTSDGAGAQASVLFWNPDLIMAPGDTVGGTHAILGSAIGGSITTQGQSETIQRISTLELSEPGITIGAGDTVTDAQTLLILGAPTEGVNNYAINVTSGVSRFNDDIFLSSGDRLYLDGGGDTYMVEESANVIAVFAGGSRSGKFVATGIAVDSADRVYLDGGVDTHIRESSANVITLTAGGTASLNIGPNSLNMPALHKFYLDGGSDTYIHESAANTVEIVTNATAAARFDSVGDLSINGGYETFDEYDDLALVRSMDLARSPDRVIRTRFDEAMKSYSREFLEESRLMSFEDSGQSFWNVTQTVRLQQGALGQVAALLYNIFERLQELDGGPDLFHALRAEKV